MNNHPIAHFIGRYFKVYLAGARNIATNTVLAYRDTQKIFFCFAADHLTKEVDNLNVEDLDEEIVLTFLDHLETVRGNGIKTRNLRLAGIRSLYGYLAREIPELLDHCRRVRSIPNKRTDHKNAVYLDNTEIDTFLSSFDPETRMGPRDQALVNFLYNTGARVSEAVDVCIADLRLDELGLVTVMGKGGKQRTCALMPDTVAYIKDYLQVRRPRDPECEALFLNAQGEPITRSGIAYIVRKYADRAGQRCPSIKSKSVSPHTLRHSIAMTLLRAGQDFYTIQLFLGHADVNTTHLYCELDIDMKRKILEKSSPQNTTKKPPRWKKPNILAFLDNLTTGGLAPAASTCGTRLCEANTTPWLCF